MTVDDDWCIAPVQGTRARIRGLDTCGAPTGTTIVIDGFVQVEVAPEYEDGTEYTRLNAQGRLTTNARGNDQFERDAVIVDFCSIDPNAVVLTTGQPSIVSGGTQVGFWVEEGESPADWSLEVWQADSATCTGATPRFAYWAWPHLRSAAFRDLTVADAPLTWALLAFTDSANPGWSPYDAAVGAINAAGHRLFVISKLEPPAVTPCGTVAGELVIDGGPPSPAFTDLIDGGPASPPHPDIYDGGSP